MFKTHLQLAVRHLVKHKSYAFINVFGLATGFAATLLLFRLLHFELSFDTFHQKYDRIARITTIESDQTGAQSPSPGSPLPAQDEMQAKVPQFEQFARVHAEYGSQITSAAGLPTERKMIVEEGFVYTEPSFFQIFDWTFLSGDTAKVLHEPNTAVLTRTVATQLFGTWQQALGQVLLLDNKTQVIVQGIVEDSRPNSDFPVKIFVSYLTYKAQKGPFGYNPDWGGLSSNDHTYVLLRDAQSRKAVEDQIMWVGKDKYNSPRKHQLQSLSEMHFDTEMGTLGTYVSSKNRLMTLGFIGMLILVMACFNFINLATALAVNRSKEVGVRKSLGGQKGQLIRQFMTETTVLVSFSALCGLGMATVLTPLLKRISEVPDDLPFLNNPMVWGFLLIATLVVSLLSGLYPSFVLARFDPITALKSTFSSKTIGGISLRKVLVLAQFCIAQALIISTIIALLQMNHIQKMELGFRPELVYSFSVASDSVYLTKFETFKQRLQQTPGIESVAFASDLPSSSNSWESNFAFGRGSAYAPFSASLKFADPDYFNTFGLKLVAGHTFSPSDTMKEVIVNETLLRRLGITNPEEAIGQEFRIGGRRFLPIVGVVADYKTASARDAIAPTAIFCRKRYYSKVAIKIQPEKMEATVAQAQSLFNETFPDQVFKGEYFDTQIADFYKDERRFSAFCQGFALLAILISCLGLLGLASLLAAQKTKEIGIRKVLGATVAGITGLLAKDFLKLVLIAVVIASPIAYYAMKLWLADFVDRIDIPWWAFVLSGLLSLTVAFITISFQSVKAALANPAKSLKSE